MSVLVLEVEKDYLERELKINSKDVKWLRGADTFAKAVSAARELEEAYVKAIKLASDLGVKIT